MNHKPYAQLSAQEQAAVDALFNFPCDFPVKVMGKADADFEALVVEIVRRHCNDLGEGAIQSRPSKGGKYLSVTATVRAHSRPQLDNLYRELSAHQRVLMVL